MVFISDTWAALSINQYPPSLQNAVVFGEVADAFVV
jgi:hypothetical protein